MRKAIAMKWVAALRSGDYKQTNSQLRNDKGFCCLGVLCNVHAQEHPKIAAKQTDPGMYLESAYTLPTEVMKWAGLSSYIGEKRDYKQLAIGGDYYHHLAAANDSGISFKRIANWIEKNYKEL